MGHEHRPGDGLKDDADRDEVCRAIREHARSAFKISHSTVQTHS